MNILTKIVALISNMQTEAVATRGRFETGYKNYLRSTGACRKKHINHKKRAALKAKRRVE